VIALSQCACNLGWSLSENGKHCAPVQNYLLIGGSKIVRGVVVNKDQRPVETFSDALLPVSPVYSRTSGEYRDVACDVKQVNM